MDDGTPTLAEALAAYDATIERAERDGVPLLAASAGLLLGVLLERSGHSSADKRLRDAMAVLERAAELERPLRLARAWRDGP